MRFLKTLFSNIWRGMCAASNVFAYLFWRNKKLASLAYAGFFLNAVAWGLLYWLYSSGHPGLVLHYNAFLGIDIFRYIGGDIKEIVEIFITPLSGLCFLLINLIISICLLNMSSVDFTKDSARVKNGDVQNNQKKELEVYVFGAYMIISGNIVLQTAILVYTVAIVFVNQ